MSASTIVLTIAAVIAGDALLWLLWMSRYKRPWHPLDIGMANLLVAAANILLVLAITIWRAL